MVISSGDMVVIGETDRLINSQSQVATQLFDSVSGEIVDFNSMVNAIKKAYSSDPSLISLINEGGITKRGWMAIFEHPKVQNLIRRNSLNAEDGSVVKKYTTYDKTREKEVSKVQSRIDNVVVSYKKKDSSSGKAPIRQSPEKWTKLEERYLSMNADKVSTGILYRNYSKIFNNNRDLSSVLSKISSIKKKKQK